MMTLGTTRHFSISHFLAKYLPLAGLFPSKSGLKKPKPLDTSSSKFQADSLASTSNKT